MGLFNATGKTRVQGYTTKAGKVVGAYQRDEPPKHGKGVLAPVRKPSTPSKRSPNQLAQAHPHNPTQQSFRTFQRARSPRYTDRDFFLSEGGDVFSWENENGDAFEEWEENGTVVCRRFTSADGETRKEQHRNPDSGNIVYTMHSTTLPDGTVELVETTHNVRSHPYTQEKVHRDGNVVTETLRPRKGDATFRNPDDGEEYRLVVKHFAVDGTVEKSEYTR